MEHYGARGISVCERWSLFENFLQDMGERPSVDYTIERLDVNGNYCPENCRWATAFEQGRNKRNNANIVSAGGISKCTAEWAEILGISFGCVQYWSFVKKKTIEEIALYVAIEKHKQENECLSQHNH